MASYVAKKVGRTALGSHLNQYEPADPHYETYQDKRGRERRRKRAIPPGLSKRDERILRSVRRRAHYLDKGFSLCGFRFGWTFLLGLIPGAGDIAQFLLGYWLVLKKCKEAELPFTLVQRMTFNQTVGLGIGLVPLVGDICLAVWKANSRNAALLEDFLIRRAAKQASSASSGGTPIDEEALAELAMGDGGGRIDRLTGEKVGGAQPASAPPPPSASSSAAVGGVGVGTSGARAGVSETDSLIGEQSAGGGGTGGKRPWYGWGRS
ncbi:hypothetical protein JCM6882_002191 [Rhodosporidiobolus microsporus]